MPLFSPTPYTRPEEKPEMTMAWVYIMIEGILSDDPTKWPQQIIYIGQCSSMTPKARESQHKHDRPKVMKNAKILVVNRFDRENENGESAEMQSLMWEFLLSAHSDKMKLISNSPGNFANRARMSLRAEKLAEEADDDLLREVAEQLETILQDEKAGRTKEETFKFKCSYSNCDYESDYFDDRNRHEKKHKKSSKPQFACQFCAEKGVVMEFLHKGGLTNHIRVAHEMPDYQRKRKPPTNKKSKKAPKMYECPHGCTRFKKTTFRGHFRDHMIKVHKMKPKVFDERYPSMIKRQGSRNKLKKNQQQNAKIIVDEYSDFSDDEREKRQKWVDEFDKEMDEEGEEMDEEGEEMDEEGEEMDEEGEEMDEEDIVELTDDEFDEAPPNKIPRMNCAGPSSTSSSPVITID